MKHLAVLLLAFMAAGAAEYNTSSMIEITPEGSFVTESSIGHSSLSHPGERDMPINWHYSIASGLTQKISCLGYEGDYVLTGGWYGGGIMFEGTGGDGTVLWQTEPQLGSGEYWKNLATGTAAAYDEDIFYVVRVFDVWNDNGTPGDPNDDYEVSADNVEVCRFQGSSSTPVWTWNGTGIFLPTSPDEPGKLACTQDGSTLAIGGQIAGHLAVAVFEADSAGPSIIYENAGVAYSPRQLRLTTDGSKVIFSVSANLYRVDTGTGTLEDTFNLGASTDCLDISGDGSVVAYGFTAAKLAEWNGSQYVAAMSYPLSGCYAGAAAVSEDGGAIYYGFYKNTYLSNRILRFDAGSSTPAWTYDTPTGSGGYQDVVSWMDCSADGEFVAVASWGCQSGGGDEVIVLENASPTTPTYSIDTPGSMWHVDMDPDGFYFTAAGKHVHANVMGSGADVYMYTMVIQGVESGIDPILPGLSLSPNPCAGQASVGFSLPQAGIARLDVYDLSGRIVQAVTTESLSSGEHSIPVSTDLPDGLYVVSLTFGDQRLTEKLVVNR